MNKPNKAFRRIVAYKEKTTLTSYVDAIVCLGKVGFIASSSGGGVVVRFEWKRGSWLCFAMGLLVFGF